MAYIKMMAWKLSKVDDPNFDKAYFKREDCQSRIQYLLAMIAEKLFPLEYKKLYDGNGKLKKAKVSSLADKKTRGRLCNVGTAVHKKMARNNKRAGPQEND